MSTTLPQKIAQIATGISAAFVLAAGKVFQVMALSSVEEGAAAARADGMPAELIGDNGVFTRITNTLLMIIGVVAVVMLLLGGLRYITSGGDSKKVTDAKNTILYAIIGLVICVLSYAIVNFVLKTIDVSTSSETTSSEVRSSEENSSGSSSKTENSSSSSETETFPETSN